MKARIFFDLRSGSLHSLLAEELHEVRSVVLLLDDDTPFVVVCETAPGQVLMSSAGEEDFETMLQDLGITKTVIAHGKKIR